MWRQFEPVLSFWHLYRKKEAQSCLVVLSQLGPILHQHDLTRLLPRCIVSSGQQYGQFRRSLSESVSCPTSYFPSLALNQRTGSTRKLVRDWCPIKHKMFSMSVLESAAVEDDRFGRGAILEDYITSLHSRIVEVTRKQLLEFISDEPGVIHDCCIAGYNFSKDLMRPPNATMAQVRSKPDWSPSMSSEKMWLSLCNDYWEQNFVTITCC